MKTDYQKEPWRESLFNICASPKICCKGFWCSACLFGDNVRHINNDSYCRYCCGYLFLSFCFLCGLIHKPMRSKIREKYGLQEEPSDCVAACLLSPFALCQEAREILSRERIPSAKVRTTQPTKSIISAADSEVASSANSSQAS